MPRIEKTQLNVMPHIKKAQSSKGGETHEKETLPPNSAVQCEAVTFFSFIRVKYLKEAQEFRSQGYNSQEPKVDSGLLAQLRHATDAASCLIKLYANEEGQHNRSWLQTQIRLIKGLTDRLPENGIQSWVQEELMRKGLFEGGPHSPANKRAAQSLVDRLESTLHTLTRIARALGDIVVYSTPDNLQRSVLQELVAQITLDIAPANREGVSQSLERIWADSTDGATLSALVKARVTSRKAAKPSLYNAMAKMARYEAEITNRKARELTGNAQAFFSDLAEFFQGISGALRREGLGSCQEAALVSHKGEDDEKAALRSRVATLPDKLTTRIKKGRVQLAIARSSASIYGRRARRVMHHGQLTAAKTRGKIIDDSIIRSILWQWQQPAIKLQDASRVILEKVSELKKIQSFFPQAKQVYARENAQMQPEISAGHLDNVDDKVRCWINERLQQENPENQLAVKLDVLGQLLDDDILNARKLIARLCMTQESMENMLKRQRADIVQMMFERHYERNTDSLKTINKLLPDIAEELINVVAVLDKALAAAELPARDFAEAKKQADMAQLLATNLKESLSAKSVALTERSLDEYSRGARLARHWANLARDQSRKNWQEINPQRVLTLMKNQGLLDATLSAGDPEGYLFATRLAGELKNAFMDELKFPIAPDDYVALEKSLIEFVVSWGVKRMTRGAARLIIELSFEQAVDTVTFGASGMFRLPWKIIKATFKVPLRINQVNNYTMPGQDKPYIAIYRMLEMKLKQLGFNLVTAPLPGVFKLPIGAGITAGAALYNKHVNYRENTFNAVFERVALGTKSKKIKTNLPQEMVIDSTLDVALIGGYKVTRNVWQSNTSDEKHDDLWGKGLSWREAQPQGTPLENHVSREKRDAFLPPLDLHATGRIHGMEDIDDGDDTYLNLGNYVAVATLTAADFDLPDEYCVIFEFKISGVKQHIELMAVNKKNRMWQKEISDQVNKHPLLGKILMAGSYVNDLDKHDLARLDPVYPPPGFMYDFPKKESVIYADPSISDFSWRIGKDRDRLKADADEMMKSMFPGIHADGVKPEVIYNLTSRGDRIYKPLSAYTIRAVDHYKAVSVIDEADTDLPDGSAFFIRFFRDDGQPKFSASIELPRDQSQNQNWQRYVSEKLNDLAIRLSFDTTPMFKAGKGIEERAYDYPDQSYGEPVKSSRRNVIYVAGDSEITQVSWHISDNSLPITVMRASDELSTEPQYPQQELPVHYIVTRDSKITILNEANYLNKSDSVPEASVASRVRDWANKFTVQHEKVAQKILARMLHTRHPSVLKHGIFVQDLSVGIKQQGGSTTYTSLTDMFLRNLFSGSLGADMSFVLRGPWPISMSSDDIKILISSTSKEEFYFQMRSEWQAFWNQAPVNEGRLSMRNRQKEEFKQQLHTLAIHQSYNGTLSDKMLRIITRVLVQDNRSSTSASAPFSTPGIWHMTTRSGYPLHLEYAVVISEFSDVHNPGRAVLWRKSGPLAEFDSLQALTRHLKSQYGDINIISTPGDFLMRRVQSLQDELYLDIQTSFTEERVKDKAPLSTIQPEYHIDNIFRTHNPDFILWEERERLTNNYISFMKNRIGGIEHGNNESLKNIRFLVYQPAMMPEAYFGGGLLIAGYEPHQSVSITYKSYVHNPASGQHATLDSSVTRTYQLWEIAAGILEHDKPGPRGPIHSVDIEYPTLADKRALDNLRKIGLLLQNGWENDIAFRARHEYLHLISRAGRAQTYLLRATLGNMEASPIFASLSMEARNAVSRSLAGEGQVIIPNIYGYPMAGYAFIPFTNYDGKYQYRPNKGVLIELDTAKATEISGDDDFAAWAKLNYAQVLLSFNQNDLESEHDAHFPGAENVLKSLVEGNAMTYRGYHSLVSDEDIPVRELFNYTRARNSKYSLKCSNLETSHQIFAETFKKRIQWLDQAQVFGRSQQRWKAAKDAWENGLGYLPVIGNLGQMVFDIHDMQRGVTAIERSNGQFGLVIGLLQFSHDLATGGLEEGLGETPAVANLSAARGYGWTYHTDEKTFSFGQRAPAAASTLSAHLEGKFPAKLIISDLDVAAMSLGSEGRFKGVYKDSEGNHYIRQDGNTFNVNFDQDANTWRLRDPSQHRFGGYHQPIRLNEQGKWVNNDQVGMLGGMRDRSFNPDIPAERGSARGLPAENLPAAGRRRIPSSLGRHLIGQENPLATPRDDLVTGRWEGARGLLEMFPEALRQADVSVDDLVLVRRGEYRGIYMGQINQYILQDGYLFRVIRDHSTNSFRLVTSDQYSRTGFSPRVRFTEDMGWIYDRTVPDTVVSH